MIKLFCPQCGLKYKLTDEMLGEKVSCSGCGLRFYVPAAGESIRLAPKKDEVQNTDQAGPQPINTTQIKTKSSTNKIFDINALRQQVTIPAFGGVSVDSQSLASTDANIAEIPQVPFIAGDFTADRILAQGGMSVTYHGFSTLKPQAEVVIKVPLSNDKRICEMFEKECNILELLKHPNIVRMIGSGNIEINGNNRPFMVMSYIAGQNLRQLMKSKGKLAWSEVLDLTNDMISALEYLDEKKICHRDIKPDNIIRDPNSQKWILVDFGIAKSAQQNILATMTMAGQDSGTWDYMAPEQLDGKSVVDIRCDIYALGTVVWEALIGKVPRRGTQLPHALGIDVSSDVDILIGKMVSHDAIDRYQTPAELKDAIRIGAGKVEHWKTTKRKTKTISRCFAGIILILILFTGVWLCGNFIVTSELKKIASANSSPTTTIRLLNELDAKSPFYWGDRYHSEAIVDLSSKANEESKKMLAEFATIKIEFDKINGTDNELDNYSTRIKNFITKWDNIFTQEVGLAKAANNKFDNEIKNRNETKSVNEIILKTQGMVETGKPDQIKAALDLCNAKEKDITQPETKQRITEHIIKIKLDTAKKKLAEIDILISSSSREDWYKAYQKLEILSSTIGISPELEERKKTIENNLWDWFNTKAITAKEQKRFSEAKAYVDSYRKESILKLHFVDADTLDQDILRTEEDNDLQQTVDYVERNIKQDAFSVAREGAIKFKDKYGTGRYNRQANEIYDYVASAYCQYISQRKDYDSFYEQFSAFKNLFAEQDKYLIKLKNSLCYFAWDAIRKIFISNDSDQVKMAQLQVIKFSDCEPNKRDYLDSLKKNAGEYFSNKSMNNLYSFLHILQRPPSDCIVMKETPNIYLITLTGITISFSDADYHLYRGKSDWDSDPMITIQENTDINPWKILGPVNHKDFTISKTKDGKSICFWFDTKGKELIIDVTDNDGIGAYGPYRGIKWEASMFSKSGNNTYRFDSGTTMSINWESQ